MQKKRKKERRKEMGSYAKKKNRSKRKTPKKKPKKQRKRTLEKKTRTGINWQLTCVHRNRFFLCINESNQPDFEERLELFLWVLWEKRFNFSQFKERGETYDEERERERVGRPSRRVSGDGDMERVGGNSSVLRCCYYLKLKCYLQNKYIFDFLSAFFLFYTLLILTWHVARMMDVARMMVQSS